MPYNVILLVLSLSVACWAMTMVLFSVLARKPTNLGVRDGRLADCPTTPNCVSTFAPANDSHAIEPLSFEGDAEEAWGRLKRIVQARPRTSITSEREGYLRAECRSLVFRFVDDVEFLLERATRKIHFRSASRAGRSDLGVNRRRMEDIRRAFHASMQ